MRYAVRVAAAGMIGGVLLTIIPVINPAVGDDSVGVVRPTPNLTEGDQRYFPSVGTVPVITPSARISAGSSVSSARTSSDAQNTKTRESYAPAPKALPSPVRKYSVTPKSVQSLNVTTIKTYRACYGYAQSCIDKGYLTLYNPGQKTLAGHNYMGYQWMSRLPVGRIVKVTSGPVAGTYRVYDHAWSKRARQGGKFPPKARAADLVLQTCEPNGTGFSLLRRV